jgi:RNA polymerase sigma-70 factor (ECF subfamily)
MFHHRRSEQRGSGTMQDYEALVRQAQQNEPEAREEAFEALIAQFQPRAEAWATHALGDAHAAQDAVQEAILTAYQKLGDLRDPAAFPGWLKRIVLTQVHRETRRYAPALLPLEDDAPHEVAFHDDPADYAEAREREAQVGKALRALPEHERVVTELFYITGYSQQEIAERLALPLTTVKKRLQYAREHLRETMPPMMVLGSTFGGTVFFDLYAEDSEFALELGYAEPLRDDLLAAA